jgi:transposase
MIEVFCHQPTRKGEVMGNVTTIGIDLAKNSSSVHGVDAAGAVALRRTVSRARLLGMFIELPPCLIGLEACSGAHEWARRLQQLGHRVKLMAPRFVAPYRKNGKNDGNDAEAICEAVSRPRMRFVPVKTPEQQAVLCLHRARQGFVEERTATTNRLRGLLAEFGVVLPQSTAVVRREAQASLEQFSGRVTTCPARRVCTMKWRTMRRARADVSRSAATACSATRLRQLLSAYTINNA